MRSNTGKNIKLKTGKSNLDIVRSYLNGEKAFVQVGYDANLTDSQRREGDQWEDGQGKKWVMKDGCRRRVPKVARFINEQRCIHCNMDVRWGNYLDDRVWPKTKLCYDCFVKNETDLKISGNWDNFNKLRELKNEKSMLIDYKVKFEETYTWCLNAKDKPVEFLEEDGKFEQWSGNVDYTKILDDVSRDLEIINKRLLELDNIIDPLELKYESAKSKRNNKTGI